LEGGIVRRSQCEQPLDQIARLAHVERVEDDRDRRRQEQEKADLAREHSSERCEQELQALDRREQEIASAEGPRAAYRSRMEDLKTRRALWTARKAEAERRVAA
jgi:hypothetical protein